MGYFVDSYERNKKYLVAFAVLAFCIAVIYTKRLVDFPKIGVALFVVLAFFIFLLPKKNVGTFLAMLIGGLSFAFITPVLNTPDEQVHLSRTIHIVEGNVNMGNKNIHITEDYFDVYKNFKKPFTKSSLFEEGQTTKQVKFGKETDYRATNSYWFIGYIPQALGFGIGKFLNLSVGVSYYLGRIFNVIAYCILALIAIKLSGKAKQLMTMVAMFPMNLVLAASYNQDSVALGLTYIIIGLFLNYVTDDEKVVKIKDLLLYAFLCVILVTMKLPYVLLVGLLLFIPKKKTQCKNYYLISLGLIAAVFVFTIFWYVLTQQVRIENFKLDGADAKSQVISIISKPHWYLPVILKVLLFSVSHLNQLYTFGWLDLSMSEVLIPIYALYTLITFSNIGKIKLPKVSVVGASLVSLAIVGLISLTLYLTWTPVGNFEVLGVQGRYYLGVVALCLPVICSLFKQRVPDEQKFSDHFVVQSSLIILSLTLLQTISVLYAAV